MKKGLFFVALLVALSAIKVTGQVGPVFPYTSPSKEALKSLAKKESAKGETYRNYLVKIINIGLRDTTLRVDARYVDFIFEHIYLEEVNLEDGAFKNSGYDPTANQMHPSLGHKIGWGFQWVFRVGTFTIVIIKRDCGNILEVPVIRRKIVEIPPPNITERFIPAEKDQNQYAWTKITKQDQLDFVNPNSNLFVTQTIRTKTWFGRNWGYIAGIVGASALTTGGIIWYNNRNHHIAVIEPRTMPPGIPAKPSTPGLPSDPRNMPPGTGMHFNNSFNSFNTTDHAVVVFKFGH